MKTFIRLLLTLTLLVAVGQSAQAQTAITTTTLTNAITTASIGSITVAVGATTGMSAGTILFMDGSVYRVQSINSLNVTMIQQFRPAAHLASSTIFVVPQGAQIGLSPAGACIRGNGMFPLYSPYTIMFNLQNGDMWTCRGALGSRRWYVTNQYGYFPSASPPVTP